jgi:hypothetical protein
MSVLQSNGCRESIQNHASAPPVNVAPGIVGLISLPGTGKLVWWTGRVAIGLRHEPERHTQTMSQSAQWLQNLMLSKPGKVFAG